VSDLQERVLSVLDLKEWKSKKMITEATEIPLTSVARVLNRLEAMGMVELANVLELGKSLANHYRLTKEGLRLQKKQEVPALKQQREQVALMRSKLFHVKDEIDKVLEWLNARSV
jgi:predicted methyltransferase